MGLYLAGVNQHLGTRMATIFDNFGNPTTSRKLFHAADTSSRRGPQFYARNKSLEDLISERDRDVIISLGYRLYLNLGACKSVVDQKATYSVGSAWLPCYKGEDKDAGKVVEDWLNKVFCKNLDVRGGLWDWWENLQCVSKEMDIRGDHFTLLTEDEETGMPKIKILPSHSIKNKNFEYKNGHYCVKPGEQWAGYKICYGIIYDANNKAVAYRVSTGMGAEDYEDIPAASIIHEYEPTMAEDGRGLPAATHALEDLKHILQSTEYERSRQMVLSSIGLFIENQLGGPDPFDPATSIQAADATVTDSKTLVTEEVSPSFWYAKAGTGEKITQLKHETGGDSFESFQDRMIRSYVAGAKWSYSLTWKPTGQGTAERGEILRARKAIASRQKRLEDWALRVVTYAVSYGISKGYLPELDEPLAWEFTLPARLTVDDGREHKMMIEGAKFGMYTMTDLVDFMGRTYEEQTDRSVYESVYLDNAIKQAEEANPEIYANQGQKIDKREIRMLSNSYKATTENDQST